MCVVAPLPTLCLVPKDGLSSYLQHVDTKHHAAIMYNKTDTLTFNCQLFAPKEQVRGCETSSAESAVFFDENKMSSGVSEALVQGNNRSTWALIRLLQCIRGPRLRRLVHMGRNVEVSWNLTTRIYGGC